MPEAHEDRVVFPDSDKDPSCPAPMPLRTRGEIVSFLVSHTIRPVDVHGTAYALAWHTTVANYEESGRHSAFDQDPAFDARWREHFESDREKILEQATTAMLSPYLEGAFETWNGNDEGDFEFRQTEQDRTWLSLSAWRGTSMEWTEKFDFDSWVDNLDDESLVVLYKAITALDSAWKNPAKIMEYHLAEIRWDMEKSWSQENGPAKSF